MSKYQAFGPLWDAALDVCVVSPFQQTSLDWAAREPGYALFMRKQQKEGKYLLPCKAQNIEFYVLPMEMTRA